MRFDTVAELDHRLDVLRRCRDKAADPVECDGFNTQIDKVLDERNALTVGVPVAGQ